MVRALKKLLGELSGLDNAPDDHFGQLTYKADMRDVLAHVFNGTLQGGDSNEWEEVNGLRYLMRGTNPWTTEDVHRMADAAWDHLGFD
jgi:hypothetical protein